MLYVYIGNSHPPESMRLESEGYMDLERRGRTPSSGVASCCSALQEADGYAWSGYSRGDLTSGGADAHV